LYHALRVVQVEGLAIPDFARLLEASGPAMTQMFLHDARTVVSSEYTNPEASIDTCQRALVLMVRSARESGLDASIPSFVEQLFAAGQRAGLGAESPAALFKLLARSV
jgi:3-hydroxyisobutyrate dehydrogenase-like beta-hydroxyacid dehydrogenase